MFKPVQMFRTSVILPRQNLSKLMSALYEKEICQIKEAECELEAIKPVDDEQDALNLFSRLSFVMEQLNRYAERKKKGIIKEYFTKGTKQERINLSRKEVFSKVNELLDIVEDTINENVTSLKKNKDEKNHVEFLISNLKLLPEIETSKLADTVYIKKFVGLVDSANVLTVEEELGKECLIASKEMEKNLSLLIVFCKKASAEDVDAYLHGLGFDVLTFPYEDKKPRQILEELSEKELLLENERREIVTEMEHMWLTYHTIFEYYHDQLQIQKDKIETLAKVKASVSFVAMEAWVPGKNISKFHQILRELSPGHHILTEERGDAPILLNNPGFIRPFEALTELYSFPRYNSFDPTPILAITFSLFFGFMLTDFVYGFILFAFGVLLFRGKGSYDEGAKKISIIMMMWGGFTLILGVLFGSYFGDFFQRIGIEVPMLIDPLRQILVVLIIALSIGGVHLTAGLIFGLIDNLKNRKINDALHKQGVWLLFVGAIISFLLSNMVVGYSLLGVSVLMQIFLTFKQDGMFPAILSVFNFSGFFGDLLSYARLMALAIGTTGIALALNFLSIMAWDAPYVGPVLAVVIFVVGHVINMLMNGLGAFVHSIRLHFLEFFSKFYEGGGNRYIPYGTK